MKRIFSSSILFRGRGEFEGANALVFLGLEINKFPRLLPFMFQVVCGLRGCWLSFGSPLNGPLVAMIYRIVNIRRALPLLHGL